MPSLPTPASSSPLELGRYGELDPFGGGISSHREQLPHLVRELKLFALVKDVVILAPNEFLEHSLTLPACEALAPFVRVGRITTTADPRVPRPMALIEELASRHREAVRSSTRNDLARARRAEISSILDRWHALLPCSWSLHRDVPAQIAGFTESILGFFDRTLHSTAAATTLRDVLAERLAARRPLDRHTVFAHIAALRPTTPPRELARLCFVVQSTYFEAGAQAHASCTLYPGAFARLARRPGVAPAELDPLPVDWDAAPPMLERRLRRLGVSPERLLALPAEVLCELAASPEWLSVRKLLRGDPPPLEVERAVAALFGRHADPTDALPHLAPTLGSSVPRLPAPWQLAVSATLRISDLSPVPEPITDPLLNLGTLTLCASDREPRAVTAAHGHLLTVLAAAGETGLSVFELEELSFDIDRIDGARDGRLGPWRALQSEPAWRASSRPGRVRGLVCRANETLAPFELRIVTLEHGGPGRYSIIDLRGTGRRLLLRGSLWALLGETDPPAPPAGLSTLQVCLWSAMADSTPHSLTVEQLAAVLGRPQDEHSLKQITDAATRFARKLVALAVPWRMVRLHRGEYALLPLRAAVRSEVP